MTSNNEILVVEQDRGCRGFLASNLTADGYTVIEAGTREQGLQLLAWRHPALVVVDVKGDTLGLIDAIRSGAGAAGRIDRSTPVIALASRGDELARVRVFEHDGDDVIAKPFSYPELRGRVRALLRRAGRQRSRDVIRVGALSIDRTTREVRVGERRIELSATEFELLRALGLRPAEGVHQAGAPSGRVGSPLARREDSRVACVPAEKEAGGRRCRGARRHGVGRRLLPLPRFHRLR
jgi:two-component system, OmpR family, response regulator